MPKDKGAAKSASRSCFARNILAADAGARFLWVTNSYNGGNGPADNHDRLYGRGALARRVRNFRSMKAAPARCSVRQLR